MAVLIAAEVFIGGVILSLVGGPHVFSVQASGFRAVDQTGKTFAPIDAGGAPHVVIDDAASGVAVTPSLDGKVHVKDDTQLFGLAWARTERPPLRVQRTSDGVLIQRPGDNKLHFAVFGFDRQHVEVAVPAQSFLDIRACSGANVSGLTAQVQVHSVDGRITATNVHATQLALTSEDGGLRLNDVSAPSIDASTSDGSIRAQHLAVGGGTLHTDDGGITLDLRSANVSIHARTQDGSLRFNGRRIESDDDANSGDFQAGTGGGSLQVSTQDGNIHITTNGAS